MTFLARFEVVAERAVISYEERELIGRSFIACAMRIRCGGNRNAAPAQRHDDGRIVRLIAE